MYYYSTSIPVRQESLLGSQAHHAKAPEKPIVYAQPALLREPHRRLSFQPCLPGERLENPVDGNGTDCRKYERGANHKIDIVQSLYVDILRRVIVGELEEGRGVRFQRRVEVVAGQEHGQDCQRESYAIISSQAHFPL